MNNIPRWNCAATGTPLGEPPTLSGGVPYLPHGTLFSWVVSRFKAASLVAALNISRGSLYKPRPVWPPILPAAHGRAASGVHVSAQISTKAGDFGGQPVPSLVYAENLVRLI